MSDEIDNLRQFGKQMQKKRLKKKEKKSFFLLFSDEFSNVVLGIKFVNRKVKKASRFFLKKFFYFFAFLKKKIVDVGIEIHIWWWKLTLNQRINKRKNVDNTSPVRLVEIKKQYGNTSVIIRKRIAYDLYSEKQQKRKRSASYFFHTTSVKKSLFDPHPSLWDFPDETRKNRVKCFVQWLFNHKL